MPTYTSGALGQVTASDIWTLDSQTAGVFGKVVSIAWGGQQTVSTGLRTRWNRPTTIGSGAFTALVHAYHQPNYVAVGSRVGTFATNPLMATADPGGNLFAVSWNSQGGLGLLIHPLANPWWFVNGILTGQVTCRGVTGTDATSSFEVTVEE